MNRNGLFIALGVTAVVGLLFGIFPDLDLRLAALFYDPVTKKFPASANSLLAFLRDAAMWLSWAFAAPAIVALAAKLIWPRRPLLVRGRKMVFIVFTITMTAGILTNAIFKSHWGRPRPAATAEFGGPWAFKPFWDPRGGCPRNCSFFSGEAATAFWTYAPAALAPPAVRPFAYAAATVFGLGTGLLRMSFGGHYASDVLIAGIVTFFVVWLCYAVLFRWRSFGWTDEGIDHWMRERGLGHRAWLAKWRDRISGDLARPHDGGLPRSFWWLLAALLGLTAFRIVALKFSVVDLFFDESQYWAWAQAPAFGYFSKPPLLAWIIAATDRVCGNGEACIRSASPLLHLVTSLLTYFIALRLYGARTAFWVGLCLALGTGLVFSSRIISTDVPLMVCWALALQAYVRLLDGPDWRWALVLGSALGFGLLAKYAMGYFLLGAALAAWLDPRARDLLRHRLWWIAIGIAALLLLPNLIWIATHHFVTLQHIQANIDGDPGLDFQPLNVLAFLAGQFAIIGPITFAAFVLTLLRRSAIPLLAADRIMIAFALPPLVLVAANAAFNHANANWAAPAGLSATIVAVAVLLRRHEFGWLRATVVIGLAVQLLLSVGDAFANKVSLPFLAKPDIYARTMGWRQLGVAIAAVAKANGAATIVADQRDMTASLIYYTRDSGIPVLSWRHGAAAQHQFDLDRPLSPTAPEPLLYVTECTSLESLAAHYRVVERLPTIRVATGRHSERGAAIFKLSGSLGDPDPLPPCGG